MNYLDYAILVVIVFYALWGLSKGLMKIILDFAGYVVAFLAAKFFGTTLADMIATTSFKVTIQERIVESFNRLSPGIDTTLKSLTIPDNITTMIRQEPQLNDIFSTYPKLLDKIESNIRLLSGKNLLEVISDYVILILSVVAIFIVVKLLFSVIVSIVLSRQDQMPLAITNRIFGLAFGTVLAFIILSFTIQMVEIYSMSSSAVLSDAIHQSKLGYLFTAIPLTEWVSKII